MPCKAEIQPSWESVPKSIPIIRSVQLSRLLSVIALAMVALVNTSCSTSFTVTPLIDAGVKLPATKMIEVVYEKPDRAFLAIARFHGSEKKKCVAGNEFCSLRETARKMGAHAIWVKDANTTEYPGDWVHYKDRMIRIYPYSVTVVSGVFVVYESGF